MPDDHLELAPASHDVWFFLPVNMADGIVRVFGDRP